MADLLVELSVGLHKYSMYSGWASAARVRGLGGLTRRLALALSERQMIAIAVARNHSVI